MANMVGAIKRVLSDPEEQMERKSQRIGSPITRGAEDAIYLARKQDDGGNPQTAPPAVVECEPEEAPMTHIANKGSRASTTSSSLSDRSSIKMGEPRRIPSNDSKLSTDSTPSVVRSVENSSGNWGWFEDVHATEAFPTETKTNRGSTKKDKGRGLLHQYDYPLSSSAPDRLHTGAEALAVTAPTYVLEESLSSQQLWKHTAGTRPPQPVEERAFYEKLWAQNFAKSQVDYHMPAEVLTATSPISLSPFADGIFDTSGRAPDYSGYSVGPNHSKRQTRYEEVALMKRLHDPQQARRIGLASLRPHQKKHIIVNKKVKNSGSGSSLTVLVRGDNVFGTTVSKSFVKKGAKGGPIQGVVDTVNISIASYRVIESSKYGKYAQFLVIYREGSIQDTVGVWKRYSDFVELSHKVMEAHISCASVLASMSPLAVTKESDAEHLPNAITSWRLLKKRQRWYRCLDAGYLSLKVFLLERFLHDILFESSSPKMLRDFVGVDSVVKNKANHAQA